MVVGQALCAASMSGEAALGFCRGLWHDSMGSVASNLANQVIHAILELIHAILELIRAILELFRAMINANQRNFNAVIRAQMNVELSSLANSIKPAAELLAAMQVNIVTP